MQAKGIIARGDDREVLRDPSTSGYFIGVSLDASLDRSGVVASLAGLSRLIDELVARVDLPERLQSKVAAVAIGLSRSFFEHPGVPGSVEMPASFTREMPNARGVLSTVALAEGHLMLYVASMFEARVNAFLSDLAGLPGITSITMERGYQRVDETEPFGYKDGVRNLSFGERLKEVFVHRDGLQLDEPTWAEDGSYMVFMKISQSPAAFYSLPDDASRDQVMGRTKDGTRLDLIGTTIHPHDEPQEPPPDLPATAHVGRAGPRGKHDVLIFRRGLPFVEVRDGGVKVGLQFCSFQASLEQFDVVFNDWMMDRHFSPQGEAGEVGPDALLDPSKGFTSIEKVGFYFVPPYEPEGLVAAIFNDRKERAKETGRLVVHKKVRASGAPDRRFERQGFKFHVQDNTGQVIPGSEFETDSTGRGICPVELRIGETFTLVEFHSPVPDVIPRSEQFPMDKNVKQLNFLNDVTNPTGPYGG